MFSRASAPPLDAGVARSACRPRFSRVPCTILFIRARLSRTLRDRVADRARPFPAFPGVCRSEACGICSADTRIERRRPGRLAPDPGFARAVRIAAAETQAARQDAAPASAPPGLWGQQFKAAGTAVGDQTRRHCQVFCASASRARRHLQNPVVRSPVGQIKVHHVCSQTRAICKRFRQIRLGALVGSHF